MFCCKDVSKKISESMDRKLPFHHRMFIRIHLMMCKYCALFNQQLMMLRKLSRLETASDEDTTPIVVLSAQARERMKNKLRAYS
ncbi:MAG: hypothetical protein R6U27_17650 [Desulfobacterales bacterium]